MEKRQIRLLLLAWFVQIVGTVGSAVRTDYSPASFTKLIEDSTYNPVRKAHPTVASLANCHSSIKAFDDTSRT